MVKEFIISKKIESGNETVLVVELIIICLLFNLNLSTRRNIEGVESDSIF